MTNQDPEQEALIFNREWEVTQKKTFTHWINSHLRKVTKNIEDLFKDLRDGKNLMSLLQVISNETVCKLERGNLRLHHVTNVNKCLDFVARKGVKLVGVGAEEIVDGNEKMTLGMVWTIILRFALQDLGDKSMSARDGLLLWCQRKTEPYDNVNIVNFSTSWKDGLPFCALIHRHRPDLLKYDDLNNEDPRHNLELAFDVAQKHLDIPRMLDVEDLLVPHPDEKSVMTYVSAYYQAFSTSHEMENAAKKLANALDENEKYDKLRNDFEMLASDLLEWLKKTIPELADRTVESDTPEVYKNLLEDLRNFKSDTKPPYASHKAQLEAALNTLKTLLKLNKKPDYVPPEGMSIPEINKKWKEMCEEERKRFVWLNESLKRHKNLDILLKKYNYKCSVHESFTKNKLEDLDKNLDDYDMAQLIALKRKHDAFKSDLKSRDSRLKHITSLQKQIKDLDYEKFDDIDKRYNDITTEWKEIHQASDKLSNDIDTKLAQMQEVDNLRMEFAIKGSEFYNWLDECIEDNDDAFLVNNIKDVEALQSAHQEFLETIPSAKDTLDSIIELEEKIHSLSTGPNPYTSITGDKLNSQMNHLKELLVKKTEALDKEKGKMQDSDELLEKLQKLTEVMDSFQEEQKNKVSQVNGGLEEQKSQLIAIEAANSDFYTNKLEELNSLIRKINDSGINADQSLVSNSENLYQELTKMISEAINLLDNQILIRDAYNISDEQMNEYKRVFSAIDKQRQGFLSPDEFRNFLIALGFKVAIGDEAAEKEFSNIVAKVDTEKTSQLTLTNFLNYVAESNVSKNDENEMMEAFKVLAEGKPYITEAQIRREMPKHADKILSRMAPYEGPEAVPGALDYHSFTGALFGNSEL